MRTITVYPESRVVVARDRDDMNFPEGYIAELVKDPSDVVDIPLDWSRLGYDVGESIATAIWAARSNDGSLILVSQALAGFLSTLVVSGGIIASDYYDLSCHITTVGGSVARQYTRTVRLRIRNR
jgi:hypothetical protein